MLLLKIFGLAYCALTLLVLAVYSILYFADAEKLTAPFKVPEGHRPNFPYWWSFPARIRTLGRRQGGQQKGDCLSIPCYRRGQRKAKMRNPTNVRMHACLFRSVGRLFGSSKFLPTHNRLRNIQKNEGFKTCNIMTRQDFIAAAQGDERLGTAQWLYWLCNMSTSDHCSHMSADELTGSDADVAYYDPNWFDVADAVLAELASVREADKAEICRLEKLLKQRNVGSSTLPSHVPELFRDAGYAL